MNDIWNPTSKTLIGLTATTTNAASARWSRERLSLFATATTLHTDSISADLTAETGSPTIMTYHHTVAMARSRAAIRRRNSRLPSSRSISRVYMMAICRPESASTCDAPDTLYTVRTWRSIIVLSPRVRAEITARLPPDTSPLLNCASRR